MPRRGFWEGDICINFKPTNAAKVIDQNVHYGSFLLAITLYLLTKKPSRGGLFSVTGYYTGDKSARSHIPQRKIPHKGWLL